MTYQQVNQKKQLDKALTAKTICYDENGQYIRRKKWPGMTWISHTKRLAIYFRDNFQCVYCGKTLFDNVQLTLDHVTPIDKYKGSPTDTVNIVTCCSGCNFTKQDLRLTTFAKIKAEKLGISHTDIIRIVRNALRRKLNIKQAGLIIKAQGNWKNIFKHLKQIK